MNNQEELSVYLPLVVAKMPDKRIVGLRVEYGYVFVDVEDEVDSYIFPVSDFI